MEQNDVLSFFRCFENFMKSCGDSEIYDTKRLSTAIKLTNFRLLIILLLRNVHG